MDEFLLGFDLIAEYGFILDVSNLILKIDNEDITTKQE